MPSWCADAQRSVPKFNSFCTLLSTIYLKFLELQIVSMKVFSTFSLQFSLFQEFKRLLVLKFSSLTGAISLTSLKWEEKKNKKKHAYFVYVHVNETVQDHCVTLSWSPGTGISLNKWTVPNVFLLTVMVPNTFRTSCRKKILKNYWILIM